MEGDFLHDHKCHLKRGCAFVQLCVWLVRVKKFNKENINTIIVLLTALLSNKQDISKHIFFCYIGYK